MFCFQPSRTILLHGHQGSYWYTGEEFVMNIYFAFSEKRYGLFFSWENCQKLNSIFRYLYLNGLTVAHQDLAQQSHFVC